MRTLSSGLWETLPQRAAGTDVCVVIVSYNNEDTIGPCLDALARHTACAFETVVVDNSPGEGTWRCLEKACREEPGQALLAVRPGHNLGFAAGCNLGARHCRGRFLLFLNPDTVLENDILGIFLALWQDLPRPGLLGPQVRDASGRIVPTCRNLPSLWRIFLDATGFDRLAGHYRLMHFDHASQRPVPQLIGACLFCSKEVFDACNGFDERFFVYFEEVDLCKRMAEAGYGILFSPTAIIAHSAGTSCESESSAAVMVAQLRRSRMLYFKKHFSIFTAFFLGVINMVEAMAKATVCSALFLKTGKSAYAQKAQGFWRVVRCSGFLR